MILFLSVLSTVFITDSYFGQDAIAAKYFWFAAVLFVFSFLIPLHFICKKSEIHITDILVGALFIYLCINYFFLHGHPNMIWWLSLLMFPLYIAVRSFAVNEKLRQWLLIVVLVVVLVQAVWGLLQLYGFARSFHNLFKITGTFFNPGPYAGFVAVGVPLALSFSLNKSLSRWVRWLGSVSLVASALVLPVTMSRAAWLAASVGCVPILFHSLNFKIRFFYFLSIRKRIITTTSAVLLLITLLSGVYFMKKDSADGRWLIWGASIEAVKENPLFGAGYGRFTAVYGDAQAAYFLKSERSPAQIMVADSPDYAFNEYVQIAVELGIVGLFLFLFLIASSLFPLNSSFLSIRSSLLSFLVFAAFSYPFSVLPLAILFVFLLALSAPSSKKLTITLPLFIRVIGAMACWCITAYGAYQILPKREAYREWQSVRVFYNVNAYNDTAQKYAALYPCLSHEEHFLFEYAQCLSKTGQHIESNRILKEYLHYGSDPMVYNCIGNNYKEIGEYEKAESMYIRASQIVPNRHYPLYLLMKLYQESGQIEKAKAMAETLLNKPVKVQSAAIREIQIEARKIMNDE